MSDQTTARKNFLFLKGKVVKLICHLFQLLLIHIMDYPANNAE